MKNFNPDSKIIVPLINMFNVCPVNDYKIMSINEFEDFYELIMQGMKAGYVVSPMCSYKYAKEFIDQIDMKYNSTFYTTWNDVTNKTRLELLADQIMHYMTTYGTDFTEQPYIPNTNPNEPKWTSYKVINPCMWIELYNKCLNMLYSGIALKSQTVKYLTDFVIEYVKYFEIEVNVDKIKNREALVILCDKLNTLPKDGQKLFAHIVYKTTGATMIINNRETVSDIIDCTNGFGSQKIINMINNLTDEQLIELSTIFNRYKRLFLAFKNSQTSSVINKISRLSKKYHKPMKRGFWETVINDESIDIEKIVEKSKEATNFKLIQIMQAIRERALIIESNTPNMYIIRNGKVFIKDNVATENEMMSKFYRYMKIYDICEKQLIENLSAKKCAIKFPEKYELVCPTSEKNFIGDFPMGTSCKLGKESVIGIYWRNEWGAHDFDLSYASITGEKISWCNNMYDKNLSVIYSGDMTNAPDGANEVIKFVSDDIVNGIVNINRYYGLNNAKYRLFFGVDNNPKSFDQDMKNYMVDPNNILLESEIVQGEMKQQSIGIVLDGKFYFYSLSCGYDRIMQSIHKKHTRKKEKYYPNRDSNEMIKILNRKTLSSIKLKDILLDAGFWEATENDNEILDLNNIDRSSLIELFS